MGQNSLPAIQTPQGKPLSVASCPDFLSIKACQWSVLKTVSQPHQKSGFAAAGRTGNEQMAFLHEFSFSGNFVYSGGAIHLVN
jgi:hypothetical protein